eukprot:403348540
MRASSSSGINKIRIIRKQQQHLQNSNENESYQSEHNQSFLKQSKTGGRRNIKITNDLSESQSSMVKIKEPSFIRSGGETIEKYYGLKNHSTRNQDTGQFQSKKLRNDQLPRKDQLISSTDQKSSQLSRLRYAKQFPLEYDPSPKQKQFTRNNLLGNFSQKIIDRQSLKTSHQRYAVKDPYGLQSEVDFQSKNNQSLIDDRNYNSSTEIDPNQTSIYFQTYNNKMYKQKESLSSFTRESNSEIRSTLSKLHEIDQKYSKHQDNLNQDCQTLLTQANRDIKSLNYKLLRIISTNNDSHINIFPMRQNHIEIIEATHIYCKINVKGYQLPARFSVMFKQDQTSLRKQQTNVSLKSQKSLKRQMPELKIWLSTHHKEPNEEHFDKYLFNRRQFMFGSAPMTKEQFRNQPEYVYFSIFCIQSCSIILSVTFPMDPNFQTAAPKKQTTNDSNMMDDSVMLNNDDSNINESIVMKPVKRDIKEIEQSLQNHYQTYMNKRYARKGVQHDMSSQSLSRNFITQNKSMLSEWNTIQDEKRYIAQENNHKIMYAQMRKEEIEQEKRKKNYFKLYRWDFIRMKREELIKQVVEQNTLKGRKYEWIMALQMQLMMKIAYDRFDDRKNEIIRKAKIEQTVKTFKRIMKKWLKRQGVDYRERQQRRIQASFKYTHHSLQHIAEERSQFYLYDFISQTAQKFYLKQRFLNYNSRMYFEKEKSSLINQLIFKKSKKAKSLSKKLGLLSNEIRNMILKLFIKRQSFDFFIKYTNWRAYMYGMEESSVLVITNKKQEIINSLTRIITKNTDPMIEEITSLKILIISSRRNHYSIQTLKGRGRQDSNELTSSNRDRQQSLAQNKLSSNFLMAPDKLKQISGHSSMNGSFPAGRVSFIGRDRQAMLEMIKLHQQNTTNYIDFDQENEIMPMFSCVPSKELMIRMIMRCSQKEAQSELVNF